MTMCVDMTVMMTVMFIERVNQRGCSIPRSRVGVQRVDLLHMMMMIVNVIQPAVSPGISVRRGRLAGDTGTHVMMIDARATRQATGRTPVMSSDQRSSRQTGARVYDVPMYARRSTVIHHARVRRATDAYGTRYGRMTMTRGHRGTLLSDDRWCRRRRHRR